MWLEIAFHTFFMLSAVGAGCAAFLAAVWLAWRGAVKVAKVYDWVYYRLPVRDR